MKGQICKIKAQKTTNVDLNWILVILLVRPIKHEIITENPFVKVKVQTYCVKEL